MIWRIVIKNKLNNLTICYKELIDNDNVNNVQSIGITLTLWRCVLWQCGVKGVSMVASKGETVENWCYSVL